MAPDQPLPTTVAEAARNVAGGIGPSPAGYELFEEIGRGGMGVVYRARD